MWYTQEGDLIKLWVYVQPGAKVTEVLGLYDNALKIRLKSAPIEGRANSELQKYLAKRLEVPIKQVRLLQGEKTRKKRLEIQGTSLCIESLLNK